MALPQTLHKHAFWLYGVIVGLAIKDALEAIAPHLIAPPGNSLWDFFTDLARLTVFLILIVRFYFGSALFFGSAYESDSEGAIVKKNYAMDFLVGFLHFLVFFFLAYSIDIHEQPPMLFRSLLVLILLFDVFWFAFCHKYDTRDLMVWWMVLNLTTLLVAALTYLIVERFTADATTAELAAYIPIIFASALDFGELVSSRPLIADWVSNLLYRRKVR